MLFKLYLRHKTRLIEWNRKCRKLPKPLRSILIPIVFFLGFRCVLVLNAVLSKSIPITSIIEEIAALLMSITNEEKKSLNYKFDDDTNSHKFKLDSTEQNNISFDIVIDKLNKIRNVNLTLILGIGERVDFIIISYHVVNKQYDVDIKANSITLNYTCAVDDNNDIRVSIDNQEVHMSAEDIVRSAILKTMVNMFTINIPKIIEVEANEERSSNK